MRRKKEEESIRLILPHGQLYIDDLEVVKSNNIIIAVQITHVRRHERGRLFDFRYGINGTFNGDASVSESIL